MSCLRGSIFLHFFPLRIMVGRYRLHFEFLSLGMLIAQAVMTEWNFYISLVRVREDSVQSS